MKEILFADHCQGVGITHVARDCDMSETIGFYKNEYQIHYILNGERFFFRRNQRFRMCPGTIAFIDKKQIPFTNVIGGKYHERILIELKEEWLNTAGKTLELDLINFFVRFHGVLQLDEEPQKDVERLLREIEECMRSKQLYAAAEMKNRIITLFLMILSGAGKEPEEFHMTKGKTIRYAKVQEMIQYIMEHYTEIYGLEDLAGIFYLDKSYLSRIFKEVTNFTVNEFINLQRVDHARKLLLEHPGSIEEISRQLGFERLSYFDRVFKKYTGMAPGQYRKSNKNSQYSEN